MRFLLDENMPFLMINLLKSLGHVVEHVRKIPLIGLPDEEIAKYAKNNNATLVTKDIEFGSLILYPGDSHYGLIILRLPYYFTGQQITRVFEEFIKMIDFKDLVGKRTIVELGKHRIRNL